MKTAKKILSLLLIMAMILVTAACGSGSHLDEGGTVPPAPDASGESSETPAAPEAAQPWAPQLSDEDRAIVEELGTLTHHTPVAEDSLSWSFDSSSGTLTVSGSGPMKDYSSDDPSPAQEYGDAVTKIVVEDGITTVGAYAFCNLYWCESAQLPDSVEYIGDWAFANDYELNDVPFTANLKEIADHAFADIMGHKPLVIPEGIEIIGKSAFLSNVFYDTISIPASAYYIEETAFANSLTVHEFIVDENNPNYTAVDGVLFSKDLSVLMDYPIYKTETHYDIPDTVTRIGDWAFAQNFFLKTITIPASVTEVGENLFRNLDYIEEYIVDENCPVLRSVDGVLYSKDMKILYDYPCHKAADVFIIPDSVETISASCFLVCDRLGTLVVPGTVKTVVKDAFAQFRGVIYLAEEFTSKEVGNAALFSEATDYGFDYSHDLTYVPPTQRDPGTDGVEFPTVHVDAMTVYYAGTQAQWDEFAEKTDIYLGDTVVICDTPFPGA